MLIKVIPYKAPKKSQRTWTPFAKYSLRNMGHQKSMFKQTNNQQVDKANV